MMQNSLPKKASPNMVTVRLIEKVVLHLKLLPWPKTQVRSQFSKKRAGLRSKMSKTSFIT